MVLCGCNGYMGPIYKPRTVLCIIVPYRRFGVFSIDVFVRVLWFLEIVFKTTQWVSMERLCVVCIRHNFKGCTISIMWEILQHCTVQEVVEGKWRILKTDWRYLIFCFETLDWFSICTVWICRISILGEVALFWNLKMLAGERLRRHCLQLYCTWFFVVVAETSRP